MLSTARDYDNERDLREKNTIIDLEKVGFDGLNLTLTFENSGTTSVKLQYLTFLLDGEVVEERNISTDAENGWRTIWHTTKEVKATLYNLTSGVSSEGGEVTFIKTPPVTAEGKTRLAGGDYIYSLIINQSNPAVIISTTDGEIVGFVPSSQLTNPTDICTLGDDFLVLQNSSRIDRFSATGYLLEESFISSLTSADRMCTSENFIFTFHSNGTVYRFTSDGGNKTQIYTINSSFSLLDVYAGRELHLLLTSNSYYYIYNLSLGGTVLGTWNISKVLSGAPLSFSYFVPAEQLVLLLSNSTGVREVYYLDSGTLSRLNCTLTRDPDEILVWDGIYITDSTVHTLMKLKLGLDIRIVTGDGWSGEWEI
ncbi:MAG: hypothetical protein J7L88_02555 [Thermoplasmata archaeon]|nr:hypothetical protein [Thermoplasmata archaeon]